MKVYKAVDSNDGKSSIFTLFDDDTVSVTSVSFSDEEEVEYVKEWGHTQSRCHKSRLEEMIDPILLAEWN